MKAITFSVRPYDGALAIVRTMDANALPLPKVVTLTLGMFETRAGQWQPLTLHEIRDCLDAVWA